MKTYSVMWEIEVNADSPREAAQKALEIQRDYYSTATVFDVVNNDDTDKMERIDLLTNYTSTSYN